MISRASVHLAQPPSFALLAALGVALAACSPQPSPQSTALTPLARKSSSLASPVVRGGDNGLELRWWVSAANDAALGTALAPFADRTVPIDAARRALLESNGLRIVAVPLDRLPDLQSRLGVIGAEQRQWLGQVPTWIEAVPGPLRDAGQTISMHDGPLRLGPGRLRLLVRCWTIPLAPTAPGAPAAALHIELIPQHRESAPAGVPPRSARGLALTPPALDPEDEGLLFTRLVTRLTAPEGDAFILVPEAPGTQWKPAPESGAPPDAPSKSRDPVPAPPAKPGPAIGHVTHDAPSPPPAPPGATPSPAPAGPSPRGITFAVPGPPSDPNPTLGEAMLTSTIEEPQHRTVRAVVLLIPRVPARYELLPR